MFVFDIYYSVTASIVIILNLVHRIYHGLRRTLDKYTLAYRIISLINLTSNIFIALKAVDILCTFLGVLPVQIQKILHKNVAKILGNLPMSSK